MNIENVLTNGFVYGFMIFIHPHWRGAHVTKHIVNLNREWPISSVNSTAIMKMKYNDSYWLGKCHFMLGVCTRNQFDDLPDVSLPVCVRLELVSNKNLDKVLEYDLQILGTDRSQFMRRWLIPDNAEFGFSLAAIDQNTGDCLGYGALRLILESHSIQPVYADSSLIATAILTGLVKRRATETRLVLPAMADKRAIVEFSHRLRLVGDVTEMKRCGPVAYRNFVLKIPGEKIYAPHEYYPV